MLVFPRHLGCFLRFFVLGTLYPIAAAFSKKVVDVIRRLHSQSPNRTPAPDYLRYGDVTPVTSKRSASRSVSLYGVISQTTPHPWPKTQSSKFPPTAVVP